MAVPEIYVQRAPMGFKKDRICGRCYYWTGNECHAEPPKQRTVSSDGMVLNTRWPQTDKNDWCGHFAPDEV